VCGPVSLYLVFESRVENSRREVKVCVQNQVGAWVEALVAVAKLAVTRLAINIAKLQANWLGSSSWDLTRRSSSRRDKLRGAENYHQ
jgi:hypothetical protein